MQKVLDSPKLNIAIVSDVFPPKCGGSGWSSFYLAKALQLRGHHIEVIIPKEKTVDREISIVERTYEDLPVTEFHYSASQIPFVRNYSRNERLYPRFAEWLESFFVQHKIQLAHAQHYLTIPPTVMACKKLGLPSVATVRDYWPVCYWTTRISGDSICPGCSEVNRLKCLVGNEGAMGALAAPVSLYMGANLHYKQKWLAQADTTLAVSNYIASNLSPFVPSEHLQVLPNFINPEQLQNFAAALPETSAAASPYLLYVGKLEANKGALLLLEMLKLARPDLPILVAGEGALRDELEREALKNNLQLEILGWTEHDEVLRLLAHCEALLFPSLWPEPLSRVLLEAIGVGATVLALDTGGTSDIIQHDQTGLISSSPEQMATQLREILQPENLEKRKQLSLNAKNLAMQKFSEEVVLAQVEQLYIKLHHQKGKVV